MNHQREIGRIDHDVNELMSKYSITKEHAACHLVNFEDDYICHKFNGGCKHLEQCRKISDREMGIE